MVPSPGQRVQGRREALPEAARLWMPGSAPSTALQPHRASSPSCIPKASGLPSQLAQGGVEVGSGGWCLRTPWENMSPWLFHTSLPFLQQGGSYGPKLEPTPQAQGWTNTGQRKEEMPCVHEMRF